MNKTLLTTILFLLFTSCSTFAMEKSQNTSLKKENPSVHLEKKSNMNEIAQSLIIFLMGFLSVVSYTILNALLLIYTKNSSFVRIMIDIQNELLSLLSIPRSISDPLLPLSSTHNVITSLLCGLFFGCIPGILLGLALVIFARISFAGMKEKIGWQELVRPLLGWIPVLLLGSTFTYSVFSRVKKDEKVALVSSIKGACLIGLPLSLFLLYYIYYKRSNTQDKQEKTRVSSQR